MGTIQNLFNSQELNPVEVIKTISLIVKQNPVSNENVSDSGLFTMFAHPKYAPRRVNWDFSNGKKDVTIIGKGVLYDSGGYNIKPDASDMFNDRYGALNAVLLAKVLKLNVVVFFVVNLIHDGAVLPGTILTSLKGKKVCIDNTDAEGRIGLAQLIETIDTTHIISFATLTGHSVAAIGEGHAEVFSKDKSKLIKLLQTDLQIIGTGRYFDDYKKKLYKGKVLQNSNPADKGAGAAKAYAFLNEFLKKNQSLTHFDIAGIMNTQEQNHTKSLKELIKAVKIIL